MQTLVEPSGDQVQKDMYNRLMKGYDVTVLAPEQKWAMCVIKLAAAVNQPGDYAALATAIKAVPGIQGISLVIDGQCPAAIPASTELRLHVQGHLRIDDVSE